MGWKSISNELPKGGLMNRIARKHTHRFSIADRDAVDVLVSKTATPNGSDNVDRRKLLTALASAAEHYSEAREETRQAFFHGLLTGYAVGLKRK